MKFFVGEVELYGLEHPFLVRSPGIPESKSFYRIGIHDTHPYDFADLR